MLHSPTCRATNDVAEEFDILILWVDMKQYF